MTVNKTKRLFCNLIELIFCRIKKRRLDEDTRSMFISCIKSIDIFGARQSFQLRNYASETAKPAKIFPLGRRLQFSFPCTTSRMQPAGQIQIEKLINLVIMKSGTVYTAVLLAFAQNQLQRLCGVVFEIKVMKLLPIIIST
jgi:hypothetical protein